MDRFAILAVLAVAAVLTARRLARALRSRASRPLELDPRGPEMRAAMADARRRLDAFRAGLVGRPEGGWVRWSEEDEAPRWGRVLRFEQEALEVEPRDGGGPRRLAVADIEDWQIEHADGSIEGGFTQRALLRHAEERWGALPPELAEARARYRPLT